MRGRLRAAVRRRRGIAGVVGLVAVLAACTGTGAAPGPAGPTTPTPAVSPSVTHSPVPSPPPRPAAPKLPAAMGEATADGAEATTRYFLDLYDYAFTTGDTAALEGLSSDECIYCNDVVAEVRQAVADGLLTERDPSEVLSMSVVEVRPAEWFNVDMRLREGEIRLLGDDGSVLETNASGLVLDLRAVLSWTGSRWRVDAVSLVEPGT